MTNKMEEEFPRHTCDTTTVIALASQFADSDTAIPDDDDDIASLASESFESLQPSSLEIARVCPCGADCSRSATIFPGDFMGQYVPRGSMSPGDLEHENVFEDHWVSGLIIDEMVALELVLSPLLRYNRRRCAHLLRDLAATADLPPNSALFSQQLLDLAHR